MPSGKTSDHEQEFGDMSMNQSRQVRVIIVTLLVSSVDLAVCAGDSVECALHVQAVQGPC